jgi:NADH-quinone oxidoreductase subunit A
VGTSSSGTRAVRGSGESDGSAAWQGAQRSLAPLLFILVGARASASRRWSSASCSAPPARPEKLSPYECGFEAFEDARMKFDVRYYLVAILFILFDLEIAFLFPVGDRAGRDRLFGFCRDDHLPRDPRGRLHLRMEEGRARMGMTAGRPS